jgi:glucosamine--fructose-6-phosphate aminotransferase (isomerizing)
MKNSILHKEIYEQPSVIRQFLDLESGNVAEITKSLKNSFEYILIAARGSSDNAARYAQYLFGTHNQFPVALATPSLFTIYKNPPRLNGALLIGISQSGQSPDIVQVLSEGKRQQRPTIAVTNDPNSPLAESADFVVNLHAGSEQAVAATKTYTASLAALALLSSHFQNGQEQIRSILMLPGKMAVTLEKIGEGLDRIERYRYMEHCAVIGRGFNYSTAFEIALKIKELTRVVAEPYSSADFRHGPIAMVKEGFPVLVIAPTGEVSADVRDLISDLRRRKSEILVISDDADLLDQAQLSFPISPGIPEWLSPLAAILPGQLFAYALAGAKGLDPDHPSGIQKITETY